MKTQLYADQGSTAAMRFGEPLRVAGVAGELCVRRGAVWLTRHGDPDDLVLHAGQHVRLGAGDRAVLEQWARDEPAVVDWRPVRVGGLRGALRAAAGAIAAVAR